MRNFSFCGEHEQAMMKFSFFFWTWIWSLGIQVQLGLPVFDKVVRSDCKHKQMRESLNLFNLNLFLNGIYLVKVNLFIPGAGWWLDKRSLQIVACSDFSRFVE